MAFGNESINKLTNQEKCKILLTSIELTNFNKRIPEQQTVKYTNLRSRYADVNNGMIWEKRLVDVVVDELVENHVYNLQELYGSCKEEYKDKMKKSVSACIEEFKQYWKEENKNVNK